MQQLKQGFRRGLSCGLVGLPNVGKSSLFNALTSLQAPASNYPFCTIEPNIGIVEIQDPRLIELSRLSKSAQLILATVEFVDIAGIVRGAHKGEGLGNQFLSHLRGTDILAQVVRCFSGEGIIHVEGKIDPLADIETFELELLLADITTIKNGLEKSSKNKSEGAKLLQRALEKALAVLNNYMPLRTASFTEEELVAISGYNPLTLKRMIYIPNVDESSLPAMETDLVEQVRQHAAKTGSMVVPVCASLESEIATLDPKDALEFLQAQGLTASGLQRLAGAAFEELNLIVFCTTGEKETRAWPILKGTTAPKAAGKIHGDIERGFIRAEVISYEDFVCYGGRARAREAGKLRAEGREYVIKDGDVIVFLHN